MTKPIGIFDSGVGGLTVAKEIMQAIPNCPIVYFGDVARMPFGARSDDDLERISSEIIHFLLNNDAQAIVVACGTISSKIFDRVKALVPAHVPVFGMIAPGVRGVLSASKTGRIGVIATEGSINAKGFENAILQADPTVSVTAIACPSFANIVEEEGANTPRADQAAKNYLAPMHQAGIDTLLLGCTHYPLLTSSITKALPDGVALVDPAKNLAQDIKQKLILPVHDEIATHSFFISSEIDKFKKIAQLIVSNNAKYTLKQVKL